MLPIETTELRSRPWPAYLLFVVGVTLFFLPHRNNEYIAQYFGDGFIAFAILMWWLIAKAKFIIDDYGITYKTIFSTKQIFWNTISKTYIKYHQHEKSGSFDWYFENLDGRVEKFSINLLSRKNIRFIAEAVVTKCRNTDIEQRIYNMAEGKFPWYIF